jgi:hypothetical protein
MRGIRQPLHLNVPCSTSRIDIVATGVAAIDQLQQSVDTYPGAGAVRLILAVNFADRPRVTVRLHRGRAGESWLAEDLEGCINEAILVRDL